MSWLGGYYRRAADCWRPLALVLGLAVYVELLLVAGRVVGFRPGPCNYGAVPWKVDIGRRGWELLQRRWVVGAAQPESGELGSHSFGMRLDGCRSSKLTGRDGPGEGRDQDDGH
jgi:hypothetical protein